MHRAILFMGAAGSGKDTAAGAVLMGIENAQEIKFSARLKDVCAIIFGWDRQALDVDLEYKQEIALYPDGTPCMVREGLALSRREIMQIVGTEMFRDQVRDDVWVRSAFAEIHAYERVFGEAPLWVFTDCRFANEFGLVEEEFEYLRVVHLHRTEQEHIETAGHSSEKGWQDIFPDQVLEIGEGELELLKASALFAAKDFMWGRENSA